MRILAVATLAALAACGPLVQIGGNDEPPAALLTLRAETGQAAASKGAPILVALPSVPGSLRTLRIPVTTEETAIAYLPEATWVEQPNQLFHRLLGEVVAARTGRPVVDERSVDVAAAHRLSGRLVEFGLDVRGEAQARVRYDAVLTGAAGYVASRRFEASVAVTGETGGEVARALNAAANDVAREVGDWIVSLP